MTKVWGFSEPSGPLQFSTQGARQSARAELKPGDRVILVGTLGEPTLESERGRILGMMEPTTEPVMSLDYELDVRDEDYNEEKQYKWPYGLHNKRAWIFDEPRPLLTDVSPRRFFMDAAQGIVPLTAEEEAAVYRHKFREIELLQPIKALARMEGQEAARKKGAPPPSTTRTGVMHMRAAPAYTYLMAIEGANQPAFKIGWAFDAASRMRQFNLASIPKLGGLRYRVALTELWSEARYAYRMEQALLSNFDANLHPSNREVVAGLNYQEIERAWVEYILRNRRSSQNR